MKIKVLFVCTENACRSQMAEGFANHHGKNIIEAFSAGSKPSGEVNRNAIIVMKEKGIDISDYKSKSFNILPYDKFDYIISMGCQSLCPYFPETKNIEWKIEDPKEKSLDFFRKIRDEIENKVADLIVQLEMEEDNA
jgi:protein-tyrosine-phosphatase